MFSVLASHPRLDPVAHSHLVPFEMSHSIFLNEVSVHKGTYLLYIQCYVYKSVCVVLDNLWHLKEH